MSEGCTCQECTQKYVVDLMIPDELWREIGMPPKSGLLCGECIMYRVNRLGKYAAYSLEAMP